MHGNMIQPIKAVMVFAIGNGDNEYIQSSLKERKN